jgi:integrase
VTGAGAVDAYLAHLSRSGYRPRTVAARRQCLRAFAETVAGGALAAARSDVEAFLGRPLAPESRRAYRAHLRAFYGWCAAEGLVEEDPTARVAPVRVPRAVPRPVSDDDLNLALARCDRRMRAWLLLMALAGLRCIEVANLRPVDVMHTPTGPLLHLRECKGGGQATLPAHPAIVEALGELPVRNGAWWECSPGYVSKEVSLFLRAAGVNATAHRLRHWAGTTWYRASGHDLLATSQLLRHASVHTTQVYAQLDPTRPAEVVRAVNVATGGSRAG